MAKFKKISKDQKKFKEKQRIMRLPHVCYLITNLVNGKVYVGVTYQKIEERLNGHLKVSRLKDKSKHQAISRAIRKHGQENFSIKTLELFDTGYLAYTAESAYIQNFKSNKPKFGYNQSLGGDRGPLLIRYTKGEIIAILENYCSGMLLKKIALKYARSYYSIFDITRLRISPLHEIPDDLLERLRITKSLSNKRKKVTPFILVSMLTDFATGLFSITGLAEKYDLSVTNTFSIVHRETFQDINVDADILEKVSRMLAGSRFWKVE